MKKTNYHFAEAGAFPVRICLTHAPTPLRPHEQRELELMYFYQASGCRYDCRGKLLMPNGGDLIAVNPGEMHACGDWGRGCVAVCVILDLPRLLPETEVPVFENLISSPEITDAFEKLKRVLSCDAEGGLRDSLVFATVYEILSALFATAIQKSPAARTARQEAFSPVIAYITQNISSEIRIGELASLMHLSESRFYHVFKESFGMAPTEYLLRRRVSHACTLLRAPSAEVTRVSQACGFCTASYFSAIFQRYMGCTPSKYRARLHSPDGERAFDVTRNEL